MEGNKSRKYRKYIKVIISTLALLSNITSTGGVFWHRHSAHHLTEGLWKSCVNNMCYNLMFEPVTRHLQICRAFSLLSCVLTFVCVVMVSLFLNHGVSCSTYVSIIQLIGSICNVIALVTYFIQSYSNDGRLAWSYYFGWVATSLQLVNVWLCCTGLCT